MGIKALTIYYKNMKYKDIDNTDDSYISLLEEVYDVQQKINKEVQYILTGMIGGNKLSKQEYKVFIERVLYKNKFEDIACEMALHQSSVKTYYNRALKKLKNVAMDIDLKIHRE